MFREDVEKEIGSSAYRTIKVVAILVAIYIVGALVFGMWPFTLISKVANSSAIIENYQWFYDQYNSIEAQRANYLSTEGVERNGMRLVLNNNIAEYNSRSKQITRNLWKAKDLPYEISMETK